MIPRPPSSTRTDTLFPDTTLLPICIGHMAVERDLVIAERNLVASVHRPLPFGQPVERCRRQIISGRNRRDIIIVLAVLIAEHGSQCQPVDRNRSRFRLYALHRGAGRVEEAGQLERESVDLDRNHDLLLQVLVVHPEAGDVQPQPAVAKLRLEPAFIAVRLRSEEHTSELQSLMRISYAVFCLKKKKK